MELDVPSLNPDVELHASPTYYGEHYGNPPVNPRSQAGSSRIFRRQGSDRRSDMKRPLLCWHCDKEGHPRHLCPEVLTKSTSQVLRDRVRASDNSVKDAARVFYNFLVALESEDSFHMSMSAQEADDATDFEAYFLAEQKEQDNLLNRGDVDNASSEQDFCSRYGIKYALCRLNTRT
jgi:hypothetical protein